jgi:organic radical activating enzyme
LNRPSLPTAALAGVPAGLQSQGVWIGHRQLFVRFAAEAETATMYTAEALASEVKRAMSRSSFHSISITGRDPLANVEYLCEAFDRVTPSLPVMLDCDGQRPAQIKDLRKFVRLVQVTLDGPGVEAAHDRAFESLSVAAASDMQHALVMSVDGHTTDAHMLRVVERAHETSAATTIVIHPGAATPVDKDRRWTTLFERAAALHGNVRLLLRLPPPTGMR